MNDSRVTSERSGRHPLQDPLTLGALTEEDRDAEHGGEEGTIGAAARRLEYSGQSTPQQGASQGTQFSFTSPSSYPTKAHSGSLLTPFLAKSLSPIDRKRMESDPTYPRHFLITAATVLGPTVSDHLRDSLLYHLSLVDVEPRPPLLQDSSQLLTPDEMRHTATAIRFRDQLMHLREQESFAFFASWGKDNMQLRMHVAAMLAGTIDREAQEILARVGCDEGPWTSVVLAGNARAVWRAIVRVYNQEHLRPGDKDYYHVDQYGRWQYQRDYTFAENFDRVAIRYQNMVDASRRLGRPFPPPSDPVWRIFHDMPAPYSGARIALSSGAAPTSTTICVCRFAESRIEGAHCNWCSGRGVRECRLAMPSTGPDLIAFMLAWARATEQSTTVLESFHRKGEVQKSPEKQTADSGGRGVILQLREEGIDIPPEKEEMIRLLLTQHAPVEKRGKRGGGGWATKKKKETGPNGNKSPSAETSSSERLDKDFPLPTDRTLCRFSTTAKCQEQRGKGFKCKFKHQLTKKEAEDRVALLSEDVTKMVEKLQVGAVGSDDLIDFTAPCIECHGETWEMMEVADMHSTPPDFVGGISDNFFGTSPLDVERFAEVLYSKRHLQRKLDPLQDFLLDSCATVNAFVNPEYVGRMVDKPTTLITANGLVTTTKKGVVKLPVLGEMPFLPLTVIQTGGNLLSDYWLKNYYDHEEPGIQKSAKKWVHMFTSTHSERPHILWFIVLPVLPTLVLITDLQGKTIWDRRQVSEEKGGGKTVLTLTDQQNTIDQQEQESTVVAPPEQQASAGAMTRRALTIEERLAQLSVRAREGVLKVERLFQMLHCPQLKEIRAWIEKEPWGKESPSKEDLRLWSQVFDDNSLVKLAGKSERVRTPRAVNIYRDPTKLKQSHMSVDLLKWRRRWYFISRMFPLRFLQLDGLPDKNVGGIIGAFTQHVLAMMAKRITAPIVQGDNEMKLALTKTASLFHMDFHPTAALQHEGGIEVAIKNVKDGARTSMAYLERELTYQDDNGKLVIGIVPRRLDVHILRHAAMARNAAYVHNGIALSLSPREYVTGRPYDPKLDGDLPFGQLVASRPVAAELGSNTDTLRVTLGLFLGPSGTNKGGFHILNLSTGEVIFRQKAEAVPMTTLVKQSIREMALKDEQSFQKTSGTDEDSDEDSRDHSDNDPEEDADPEDTRAVAAYRRRKKQEREKMAALKKSVADLQASKEEMRRVEVLQSEMLNGDTLQQLDHLERQLRDRRKARAESLRLGQGTSSALTTALSWESEIALLMQENDSKNDREFKPSEDSLEAAREIVASLWQQQPTAGGQKNKPEEMIAMSAQKAISVMGPARVRAALAEEVAAWVKAQVGSPKRYESLSAREKQCILSVLALCDEKLDAAGNRIKDKARIVANGAIQDKHSYDTDQATLYSGTASEPAVKITMAVGAEKGWRRATYDVKSAFTKGDRFPGSTVVLHLPALIATIFVEQRPEWAPYVEDDGTLYLVLEKSIYGLCEASRMWNENIEKELKAIGFKQHPMEKCVYYGLFEGRFSILNLHVDDMGIEGAFDDDTFFYSLKERLENVYGEGEVKLTLGVKQDFLGMVVDKSKKGQTKLLQSGFTNVLLKNGLTGTVQGHAKYPADESLFTSDDSAELDPKRAKIFKSVIMQLNWLAQKTRPDLVTAVAAFSTRMTTANEGDWKKVEHTLRYLNATKEKGLILRPGVRPGVQVYVDASFPNGHEVVQAKGKSRSGYSGHYGAALIFCRSMRQKLVTRSTAEAEIVAMDDASSLTMWVRGFLDLLGLLVGPVVMYEDNQSTIAMVKNGNCTAERTRHINVKYFWLHDKIKAGEIVLRYIESENNVADYFTKSIVDASLFRRFTEYLMGEDRV
jgi:hypothetical protein